MLLNIYKEKIDPFYTQRGYQAELILREMLKQKGFAIKWWDAQEIGWDNFPSNKEAGGLIDIAITAPNRQVVECKSKNISKLNETKRFINDDYEHQAQHYGYLSKCDDINLIYVFFTDEQEQIIREGRQLDTNPSLYTFYGYKVKLDREKYASELQQCIDYKNKCLSEMRIPLSDISEKTLQYLKEQNHLK